MPPSPPPNGASWSGHGRILLLLPQTTPRSSLCAMSRAPAPSHDSHTPMGPKESIVTLLASNRCTHENIPIGDSVLPRLNLLRTPTRPLLPLPKGSRRVLVCVCLEYVRLRNQPVALLTENIVPFLPVNCMCIFVYRLKNTSALSRDIKGFVDNQLCMLSAIALVFVCYQNPGTP